mgnify:CR=1 FL=1
MEASEVFGYREEAPGISTPPGMRMNKSVHWVADDALLGPIMQRMESLLPTSVDGRSLYGRLSHRLNMYRYDDNDVFNRHIDGDWPGYSLNETRDAMVEWQGVRSALTMILYLNDPSDGVQGGNTRLLAKNGQTFAQRFDWSRVGEEIFEVYEMAIVGKGKVGLVSDNRPWNRIWNR